MTPPAVVFACRVPSPPLPTRPESTPCPDGLELCYSKAQAWELSAWLSVLIATYKAARDCNKNQEITP